MRQSQPGCKGTGISIGDGHPDGAGRPSLRISATTPDVGVDVGRSDEESM